MKLRKAVLHSGAVPMSAIHAGNRSNQRLVVMPSDAAVVAASMQPLIDGLPEEIAILDADCTILAANQAWIRSVAEYGYPDLLPGRSYRDFCASRASVYVPAARTLVALDEILAGKRRFWRMIYNGKEQWSGREFQLSMRRIEISSRSFLCVTRVDLTELVELRRIKQESGASVLEGQAAERLRMARELHDSTSQLLASLGLTLGSLKNEMTSARAMKIMEDLQGLLADTHREIRSISFLAHPPALEHHGLTGALRSLVDGFAQRLDLQGRFELVGDPVPVSRPAEAAIYRVAQEAMANIRHAQATRVRLSLCFRRAAVHVVIADDGRGIATTALGRCGDAGVGLASMRERLDELGGRLSFRKLRPGTAIVASISTNRA